MIRIPAHTTIIGELRCEGATRVDARIEGEGNIKGVLLISKSCVWVGKITADKIIIEGTVEGQIIARQKVQLSSSAKISGSITAPEMHISRGASLNCDVEIAKVRIPVELIKLKTKTTDKPVVIEEKLADELVDELAQRRRSIKKTA